jgi:hypothetical protein
MGTQGQIHRTEADGHIEAMFTAYCYWVVSYKASHVLLPFSDLLIVPI